MLKQIVMAKENVMCKAYTQDFLIRLARPVSQRARIRRFLHYMDSSVTKYQIEIVPGKQSVIPYARAIEENRTKTSGATKTNFLIMHDQLQLAISTQPPRSISWPRL